MLRNTVRTTERKFVGRARSKKSAPREASKAWPITYSEAQETAVKRTAQAVRQEC